MGGSRHRVLASHPGAVTSMPGKSQSEWNSYLYGFHQRNPGITEDILSEARDVDDATAYEWALLAAEGSKGRIALDLACGSSPLQAVKSKWRWVGLDRSNGELTKAANRHCGPTGSDNLLALVHGDGQLLPFRDSTFDLVACSMAVMLFEPVNVVLAEAHRVLNRGGVGVFLLPGSFPLSFGDRIRYTRLLAAMKMVRPAYPTSVHLKGLSEVLSNAGLVVVKDERRCFDYSLSTPAHARRFVESLYLPRRSPRQFDAGVEVATRWVGSTIGIPLRRVVCENPTI